MQHAIQLSNRYLIKHFKFEKLSDAYDISIDAVVLLIHKIQEGQYHLNESRVSTFLISIAINMYRNYTRKKKWRYQPIEQVEYNVGNYDESLAEKMEREQLVKTILSNTSFSCRKIIEYRYIHQLSDKEILEKRLLPYKSIGSLKTKRSKCLRALKDKFQQKIKRLNIL